ncbi:MAG: endonuclease domain-containing protein [Pseudomonadota bacterium]|nr:endonuclease domain-containing protein [Pseudomonadota bacterium]
MLSKPGKTVRRARQLRRTLTLPEIALWAELRRRPDGFKFRRQHPAGPYVLDFYCAEARLCIEVDGTAHSFEAQAAGDARRDALLAEHGIATLRIGARDVLRDLDAVLTYVLDTAAARLPLHHPAAPGGPPPRAKLRED